MQQVPLIAETPFEDIHSFKQTVNCKFNESSPFRPKKMERLVVIAEFVYIQYISARTPAVKFRKTTHSSASNSRQNNY